MLRSPRDHHDSLSVQAASKAVYTRMHYTYTTTPQRTAHILTFSPLSTGCKGCWIFLCGVALTWFPDDDPLGTRTCRTARFQASAVMLMRSALFCDIAQHHVVIVNRHFGTTYRSHLQGSRPLRMSHLQGSRPLRMGPIYRPDTLVNSYHTTSHNMREEHRSHVGIFNVILY
jgi:hypothetical protein